MQKEPLSPSDFLADLKVQKGVLASQHRQFQATSLMLREAEKNVGKEEIGGELCGL